ncbi:MAG: YjfB family protein [Pseudobutyrivibrio sp.]|uniref:YjfB family protein n=1 Tax=Pseudobutyrivibrio sp. TaxID=2014367 RepID=UPI001B55B91B|nr:YjfB family protein [Pseudobutyrivibrio sp.]MBP5325287.1 YjfB family protein [Pseudobutyrivibrio sp.]MBP5597420.1 YjfB family protein [Pseudobutyrivibrio sp.]MBQ7468828.1 YjfB family protein [Pseudobutyrivibrio sp.]MBR5648968.1 YjfB family protein [Pseudobutyrivibrio sp.]
MDIAQISMNLSQNKLMSAVGTSMLSKSLDLAEGQAQMLAEGMNMNSPSLESLVYPTSGTSIDLRI